MFDGKGLHNFFLDFANCVKTFGSEFCLYRCFIERVLNGLFKQCIFIEKGFSEEEVQENWMSFEYKQYREKRQ